MQLNCQRSDQINWNRTDDWVCFMISLLYLQRDAFRISW
jgi:hypothetical protein